MSFITLLSDFGLRDASVASVKGTLSQHVPDSNIVDISHLVEPYQLQQAAYLVAASYRSFPPGTCHILLIDVFSGKEPRLVLCEKDGQYFLGPDNGLLSLAFGTVGNVWNCYDMQPTATFKDWLNETGKIVAQLQTTPPAQLSLQPCDLRNAPQHCQPIVEANSVECQVIHIDRFENVVLNLTREQFEELRGNRNFRIRFMRDEEVTEISTHYYNVRPGEKLCRFNSTGYLEIAINRGPAASLFGFRISKDTQIQHRNQLYNTVKILFE